MSNQNILNAVHNTLLYYKTFSDTLTADKDILLRIYQFAVDLNAISICGFFSTTAVSAVKSLLDKPANGNNNQSPAFYSDDIATFISIFGSNLHLEGVSTQEVRNIAIRHIETSYSDVLPAGYTATIKLDPKWDSNSRANLSSDAMMYCVLFIVRLCIPHFIKELEEITNNRKG